LAYSSTSVAHANESINRKSVWIVRAPTYTKCMYFGQTIFVISWKVHGLVQEYPPIHILYNCFRLLNSRQTAPPAIHADRQEGCLEQPRCLSDRFNIHSDPYKWWQ